MDKIIFLISICASFIIGLLIGVEINIYKYLDNISWEVIIGLCSLLVAALAFFHTILHSYETIKFNKATVRPHLTFWTHTNYDDMRFELFIRNNGVGPAIINDFQYLIDDVPVEGDGTDKIRNLFRILVPDYKYKFTPAYIGPGYVMKTNDDIRLFDIEFNGDTRPTKEFVDTQSEKINIHIEFESVYGEKRSLDIKELLAKIHSN